MKSVKNEDATPLVEEKMPVFQNMASFRNMLVHRYEKIDDEIVYGIFQKRLSDFQLFIDLIQKWVFEQT